MQNLSFIREILYFLTSLQSIVRKSQNAYYFSFMKLIVSTFLVYKVKKCLLKSGKVSSSDGPFMPFGWSACARYTGIRSPLSGHRQPLCWAIAAHNAGQRVPKYRTRFWAIYFMWFFVMFKQSFCDVLIDFLRCFNSLFSLFQQSFLVHRAVFDDTSIVFYVSGSAFIPL